MWCIRFAEGTDLLIPGGVLRRACEPGLQIGGALCPQGTCLHNDVSAVCVGPSLQIQRLSDVFRMIVQY